MDAEQHYSWMAFVHTHPGTVVRNRTTMAIIAAVSPTSPESPAAGEQFRIQRTSTLAWQPRKHLRLSVPDPWREAGCWDCFSCFTFPLPPEPVCGQGTTPCTRLHDTIS